MLRFTMFTFVILAQFLAAGSSYAEEVFQSMRVAAGSYPIAIGTSTIIPARCLQRELEAPLSEMKMLGASTGFTVKRTAPDGTITSKSLQDAQTANWVMPLGTGDAGSVEFTVPDPAAHEGCKLSLEVDGLAILAENQPQAERVAKAISENKGAIAAITVLDDYQTKLASIFGSDSYLLREYNSAKSDAEWILLKGQSPDTFAKNFIKDFIIPPLMITAPNYSDVFQLFHRFKPTAAQRENLNKLTGLKFDTPTGRFDDTALVYVPMGRLDETMLVWITKPKRIKANMLAPLVGNRKVYLAAETDKFAKIAEALGRKTEDIQSFRKLQMDMRSEGFDELRSGNDATKSVELHYKRELGKDDQVRVIYNNLEGKGDALMVKRPGKGDAPMIIDTAMTKEDVKAFVANARREMGLRENDKIRFKIVITHEDEDHLGGLRFLLGMKDVILEQVVIGKCDVTTDVAKEIHALLAKTHQSVPVKMGAAVLENISNYVLAEEGVAPIELTFEKVGDFALATLPTHKGLEMQLIKYLNPKDKNESSILTRLVHNGVSHLLTSDAPWNVLSKLADTAFKNPKINLRADFLKFPHHISFPKKLQGGFPPEVAEFFNIVAPQNILFSNRGSGQLPQQHKDAIKAIDAVYPHVKTYWTIDDGLVKIVTEIDQIRKSGTERIGREKNTFSNRQAPDCFTQSRGT